MVNPVTGLKTNKITSEEEAQKISKQNEEKKEKEAAKIEEKKTEKTDQFAAPKQAYTNHEIKTMVFDYIQKLKAKNEFYPDIIIKLDKYWATFKVEDFLKNYPGIETRADVNSAMLKETSTIV